MRLFWILLVSSFVFQIQAEQLCLNWQVTQFEDSCTGTGIHHEGSAFVDINSVPVPFFTDSDETTAFCPNPHFTGQGFSCGGDYFSGLGCLVRQKWYKGCFIDILSALKGVRFLGSSSNPLDISTG